MLNKLELVELNYLFALGFNFIARYENGNMRAFKEKPVRNQFGSGYGTWVIGKYPIKDHSLYENIKLGKYEFVTWEKGVFAIGELIQN